MNNRYNLSRLKVAVVDSVKYFIFGLSWILLSEIVLKPFVKDDITYKQIQIFKGLFYIIITTIYIVIIKRKNVIIKNEGISELELKVISMRKGIEEEEFNLFYQPQVNLITGEIVGFEVLTRWIHPKKGVISPMNFIPFAEETGQIYDLERYIIDKALSQVMQWEKQGFNYLNISINISGKTLTSEPNFLNIENLLAIHNIDYSKITFELTETAFIKDIDIVVKRLKRLKDKGIKIALDDFGSGYSSFSYMQRLPLDYIKLDKSLINLIPYDYVSSLIIEHIMSLAMQLKYKVIVEGIETNEQLNYLQNYDFFGGQGFLFSKPLPIEKIIEITEKPYNIIISDKC